MSDGDGSSSLIQGNNGGGDYAEVKTSGTSSRVVRLCGPAQWQAWNLWFRSQLMGAKILDSLKEDGNKDHLATMYALIGSSVGGDAVATVVDNAEEGNGFEAYEALKKAYAGTRQLETTRSFQQALVERQGKMKVDQYLTRKRSLLRQVEAAYKGKQDQLWKFVKCIALIVNLDDEKLVDPLGH